MSESCNFQNLNKNCFDLCLSSGCTLELLTNTDCDQECNNNECGWDYGSCGYCAQDCFLEDLTTCKSSCMVPECLPSSFCASDESCDPGCTYDMVGNGICNEDCLTRNCNFDDSDCVYLQIAKNCYLSQLSDGICDDDCNNDEAFWDGWDCSCSPGCTDEKLGNAKCDSDCNNKECNFDSQMCLECATGCKIEKLGDGNCDYECLTIECYFDLGDCNCGTYCNTMLQGNQVCDSGCNTVECGYDAGACQGCSSGCTYDKRHNSQCDTECDSESCNYDDFDCICSAECLSSMVGNGTCEEVCNTYECGYDGGDCEDCSTGCFSYFLGDGKCDGDCNNEVCLYDNYDCLCAPGCTDEKLANDLCDQECNNYLCNFDNMHCTPCLCDPRVFGNGICDTECNNSECYFDGGDCQCPASCTSEKLSNNICDSECNSPYCNFDNNKCLECASGCKWSQIGDGECQVACTVAECGFDGSDCSCNEDCKYSDLMNGDCNEGCESSQCMFDNYACIQCSSGCDMNMIGDGVCQPECYNAECGYDSVDCLCSPYCLSVETCDPICITAECDYSRNVCEIAEIIRNLVNKGVLQDFQSVWDPEPCNSISDACLTKMMDDTCDSTCNVEECLWDLGSCSTCDNTLCLRCINDYCIKCHDGYYSFWGQCLTYIPISSTVYSDYPYFLIPKPDKSSFTSPSKIYVSASKRSSIETGSLSNPFSSLSSALSSIHQKYTQILLLAGVHYLTQINPTDPNILNKTSQYILLSTIKSYKMIKISTLFCSSQQVEGCADEPAIILYMDSKVVFEIRFSATFIIENIVFNGGFSLDNTCLNELCYYCPYYEEKNSVYYDDKEKPFNLKLVADECEGNRNSSFIKFLNGGTLYLANVTFYNFRQQFRAVIDMNRVAATFVNVSFMYVQAASGEDSAVVLQDGGSLFWILGMVKFVNYGYEKVEGLTLGKFLKSSNTRMVKIKYLLIDWNIAYNTHLLEFINVQNFLFEYSQVTFNRVKNLIYIEITENSQMTHIILTNTRFLNNFLEQGSLLLLNFKEPSRTLFIDSCEFSNNTLYNSEGLMNLQSSLFKIFHTPLFSLSNLKFSFNSGGQTSCIYIKSLLSINLTNIQITQNLEQTNNPSEQWINKSKALDYYYKSYNKVNQTSTQSAITIIGVLSSVYLENIYISQLTHQYIISFTKNNKISLNQLQFLFNTPASSVIFMSENNETIIRNSQFMNNTSGLSCIFISNQVNNHMYQVQYLGNKVYQGTVHLLNSDLSMARSQFKENFAVRGSGLYIKLSKALTVSLQSTQFTLNTAKEGTIYISSSETSEKLLNLLINMNSFMNNSAESGSGLYSESLTLSESSSIINTQFQFNQGSKLGVLVIKENTISISNSQIKFNKAQQAAGIYYENLQNSESKSWISNSLISNNTGESVIYSSSLQVFTQLFISGVAFINNTGHCLQVLKSYIELNSTYFVANQFTHAPCIHSTTSNIFLRDSQIMYNYGVDIGAMRVSSYSLLSISNCTFYFNIGNNGGCLYISELGYTVIDNSKFLNNISPGYGPVLYIIDTGKNLNVIKASIINENIIGISGVITSLGGSVELYDSVIKENKAYGFSPGISTSMGNVTMYRCYCSGQTGYVGSFISSTSLSHVKIFDSVFTNSYAIQGGAILISTSYITSINCIFINVSAELGGGVSIISASEGSFYNLTTLNTTATDVGGVFYNIQSSLSIFDSTFKDFKDRAIYADKAELIKIKNSNFSEGSSEDNGGLLFCLSCIQVFINSSRVSDIKSYRGGAISLIYQENQKKPSCYIVDSIFENISAVTAGVISAQDYSLVIENSEFYNNSATGSQEVWGSGGVIQFSCEINEDCSLNMTGNVLMYNFARENGGCIEWDSKEPLVEENLFEDNQASYGNNIASFPVRIMLFSDGQVVDSLNLTDVAPGQKVDSNISIVFLDHYDQIITTDNTSTATLSLQGSDSFVTGETSEVSTNGQIDFTDFQIYADVSSTQTLLIHSDSIQTPSSNSTSSSSNSIKIQVYMRNCSIGESFSNKACVPCAKGQYNLEPNGPCLECPSSAYCFGNYSIVPKKNYWRSSIYSTQFHRCPLINTCLGGKEDTTLTGKCAKGYRSNLCQSCKSGYSRSTGNVCQKCPDMKKNIVYLSLIVIFIILVVCGLVYINISMADKPASNYTILIKILLNYIQIIGIVASMNLDWPDFALDYLKIQETAGSLSQQSFSFDCFVSEKYNRSNDQVYFDKIILYLIMPTALTGICLFLWSVVSLIKLDSKYIKNHFVGSVVIIALLLHSIIIKICFSPFSCRDIEGSLYLNDDLSIRCWTGSHKIYTLSVALPGAIVWGIFIPFIILYFTYRNKKVFGELAIKQRYGFVIAGYETGTYYWEIVILYRKALVISASIIFGALSVELQTLSVLIILLLASYMQSDLKPFLGESMNKMEFRSILVSIVTIYCGLYYLTPNVSSTGRVVLFVLLVIVNTAFFTYWSYYFVKDFSKATCLLIKEILNRKRRSIVPDASNRTPEFKDGVENDESLHIIDTSENHDDRRLSLKRSLRDEEDKSEKDLEEQELDNSAVFIKEGKKVSAMSVVVKGADAKGGVKESRNTVRYNAFAEDSD